jgi:DNA repair exonuclease SbcCD nuclease subunit
MPSSLRLTVTSDIHIGDWLQHSEIGPDGRPSRLLQYLTLADDILAHAELHVSDGIILAGDIVEASILRPMVIDVLKEFFDKLSDFPIYVIHGQHDLDAKKTEIAPYHSVLAHLRGRENINYADRPRVYRANGFTLLACPWGQYDDSLPEADVFVGHGFVQGSSNYDGHIFNNGFRRDDLWRKYVVSIIGDVHNAQAFEHDGRLILVPGNPLQNSFKDAPTTGLWRVTLDAKRRVSREFTSIHDIRPDFYHRFLTTDDPSLKSTGLVHYRYREPKQARGEKLIRTVSQTTDLLGIAGGIIAEAKVENKDQLRAMLAEAVSGLKRTDRQIPRSKVHGWRLHNFMSIGDFSIELDEFADNLVIIGANGQGKTSLFEGLYWILTGRNTRGVPVSDVVNDYAEDGTAWGEVDLQIEEGHYQIWRRRGPGGPGLEIRVWNREAEAFVAQDRSSNPMTDESICKMLGLSASEILLLCYFSAKEPVLFGTLGASDRNSLMATINGSSDVDTLRGHFSVQLSDVEKTMIATKSTIETLTRSTDHLKTEIRKLADSAPPDTEAELKRLHLAREELEKLEFASSEAEIQVNLATVSSTLSAFVRAADSLKQERSSLQEQRRRIETSIVGLKAQLRKAVEGQCPTCGQELQDESVVARLSADIQEMRRGIPTEELFQAKINQITEAETSSESLAEEKDRLEGELAAIRGRDRRLRDTKDRIAALTRGQPDRLAIISAHQQMIERNSGEISAAEARLIDLRREFEGSKFLHSTLLKRNGPLIQALNVRTKILLQEQIDLITQDEDIQIRVQDDLSVSGSFLGRGLMNYKKLSPGQERIIDIASMVALNNLFTKLYALEEGVLGLVAVDEVISFLDDRYVDFAYHCFQQLKVGKRIFITHDGNLISKFDYRINVSLSGKESSCYVKSWQ